jgi:hypothetical protein
LSRLGPRVGFIAFLAFLLLSSASSVAQTAEKPGFSRGSNAFSAIATLSQNYSPNVWSDPLWNNGDWGRKKKKPPVQVPEGGSTAMYLSLTGFACLAAISMKKRQTSE